MGDFDKAMVEDTVAKYGEEFRFVIEYTLRNIDPFLMDREIYIQMMVNAEKKRRLGVAA